jgi:hypothetical protein
MADVALGAGVTAGVFLTLTGLSVLVYFWYQRRNRTRQLALSSAPAAARSPVAVGADYPDLNASAKVNINDDAQHSARSERSHSNAAPSQRERAPTQTQYAPINKRLSNPTGIKSAGSPAPEPPHSAYSDVPRQSAVADDAYSALPGRGNIDHVGAADQRYDPLPLGPPTDSAESVAVAKSYGYASAASARAKAEKQAAAPNSPNPKHALVVGVHSMVGDRSTRTLVLFDSLFSQSAAVTSQRFIDDEPSTPSKLLLLRSMPMCLARRLPRCRLATSCRSRPEDQLLFEKKTWTCQ